MKRALIGLALVVLAQPAFLLALPRPKEGVLIPKDKADEIRARVLAFDKTRKPPEPAPPGRPPRLEPWNSNVGTACCYAPMG
jgi:hypothetical protein